jgi:beta-glucanase (GH16 family)
MTQAHTYRIARAALGGALVGSLLLTACTQQDETRANRDTMLPTPPPTTPPAPAGWRMTFADEFDAPQGQPPDQTKWGYDLGGHGWGNNELQCYTNSTTNAFHDGNGHLVIRAQREQATDDKGNTREYTSARILTKGKFSQTYGRFEARMQMPRGQGIWPAFWMLGDSITTKGWPACGEIDIMEFLGHDTMTAYTTLHGPGYSGAESKSKPFKLTSGPSFSDGFHVFAAEWSPDRIDWFINGQLCHTRTPADVQGNEWVFNTPHFMILNLAVGGNWPGVPNAETTFPQEFRVDYVRAYERVSHP